MIKVLGIFDFLSFGWADVLDVLMVALLIYFLIRSIRGDSSIFNIVLLLVFLLILQAVVTALNMRMMSALLDALLVGVGQALATMPGISRSGMTISASCFLGFERSFAVRFSFLLSIPAVLGANILSLKDALEAGVDWAAVPVYLAGVVASAVVGYACIRLLKLIAQKGRFGGFAYYCWAVGLLTLLLNLFR